MPRVMRSVWPRARINVSSSREKKSVAKTNESVYAFVSFNVRKEYWRATEFFDSLDVGVLDLGNDLVVNNAENTDNDWFVHKWTFLVPFSRQGMFWWREYSPK